MYIRPLYFYIKNTTSYTGAHLNLRSIWYHEYMSKSLPNYRNDNTEGMPAAVKAYLDKHYLGQLPNLEKQNPKLLVVFSGGNALGKTTLAHAIRDQLGAIILENDEIKTHVLAFNPALSRDEANQLTWQYSVDLYKRLPKLTTNGLVVRDGVIDWYFDRVLPIFEQGGYRLFVIAFDVSDKRKKELIVKRGNTPTVTAKRLLSLIPEHKIHIQRFRKAHKPTIIIKDENLFDTDYVIHPLKDTLAKQN